MILMILADKIINLRKKNGWSQEELADKLNVSRQAVSKWEGAKSIPDLNKIIEMSKIFNVSTDYLLKDEIEESLNDYTLTVDFPQKRQVSLEECNRYLACVNQNTPRTIIAVFLCIISPILLILLSVICNSKKKLSTSVAYGIGLGALLVFILIAVVIFMLVDNQTKEFKYLDKEPFETEYGVSSFIKDLKKKNDSKFTKYNIIGIVFCFTGVIALIIMGMSDNDIVATSGLCILLVMVAIGTSFFIYSENYKNAMDKISKDSLEKKEKNELFSSISAILWLLVTSIYLGWSFISYDWHITWIIWPIAGLVDAVIWIIIDLKKKNNK